MTTTTTPAPATSSPKIIWDRETCGRCCGTGQMPYAVMGGVCFSCAGKGERLTRTAVAAREAYIAATQERRRIAAADVKVGDRVALSVTDRAARVTKITYRERATGTPNAEGVTIWEDGWYLHTSGTTTLGVSRSSRLYRALTHDDVLAGVAAIARRKGYRLELPAA